MLSLFIVCFTPSFISNLTVSFNGHRSRLAGFTTAWALTAITPAATGITAEWAALKVAVKDPYKFPSSDFLIHFLFLLFHSFDRLMFGSTVRTYNGFPVTVPGEVKQSVA